MKNKSTYSPKTKILAFILTLLIIFSILPISAIAEGIDTLGGGGVSGADIVTDSAQSAGGAGTDYSVKRDVFEAVELREANVKHFRLEDGSYLAASYASPVHVLDSDGVWQDIDNRLISSGSEYATSGSRIKFAKKITGNESLFTLHENNTKITMGLEGAIKKTEGRVTSTHDSDEEEETTLGKLMNLENLSSSIIYEDILDGVDLEYIVDSVNIKENIIVKERKDAYSYTFNIALNNLEAVLNGDGSVSIVNAAGESSYTIPAPVVYDSSYTYAPDSAAAYTLTDGGNGKYTLTVTVSADWMNAEDRAFPVVVDPTVEAWSTELVSLTMLVEEETEGPYEPPIEGVVGLHSRGGMTLYMKANVLPTLSEDAYVTDYYFNLAYMRSAGHFIPTLKTREVISAWDESTFNYTEYLAGAGQLSTEYLATNIQYSSNITYKLEVTDLVDDWYNDPASNYGIAVEVDDPLALGLSIIYQFYDTVNMTGETDNPVIEVNYTTGAGVEDYWSYTSQSVGAAGDGSVNLSNGNLVFAIDTLTTTDYLMPTTLSLVYNSCYSSHPYCLPYVPTAYTAAYTGSGFKLNIQETLMSSTDSYVLCDADGTEHYFIKDASSSVVYYDDSGLRMKLRIGTDHATITDVNNTTRTFIKKSLPEIYNRSAWVLQKITDKVGNSVEITYDAMYRPTALSLRPNGGEDDSAIEMLKLYYNSSGYLSLIRNATTGEGVAIYYITNNNQFYLSNVYYVNATEATTEDDWTYMINQKGVPSSVTVITSASYGYDSSGHLKQAQDALSGRYVTYGYSTVGDVQTVTEYGNGGVAGQSVTLCYGDGYTDVITSGNDDTLDNNDDVITRFVFDDSGRAVNRYSINKPGSEIYGAVSGTYETQENIKNNIKESTTIGGSPSNYIMNGNFGSSYGSFEHWTKSENVSLMWGMLEYYYVDMNMAPGSTDYISQNVSLLAGEYTLSFNYKSVEITSGSVAITVTSSTGEIIATKELELSKVVRADTAVASLTFTVPNVTDGKDTVEVKISSYGATESGRFMLDQVILTEGVDVQPYNYVTAGHFETSHTDANGTAITTPDDHWTNESGGGISLDTVNSPFNCVAKVSANSSSGYIKQRFYTVDSDKVNQYDNDTTSFTSNTPVTYLVSGFAFASGTPTVNGSFEIRVDVYYYQGAGKEDVVVSHSFEFQKIKDTWQFASGMVNGKYIPEAGDTNDYRLIHYIDVICDYSGQPNGHAYFDNISVTDCSENSIYKYYYYADGNLAKKESWHDTVYYEYVDNSNLVSRIANNNGEIYDYTYNSYGQPTQEVYSTFTRTDGVMGVALKYYPFGAEAPDELISLTPVSMTEYGYNIYGLPTTVISGQAAVGEEGVIHAAGSKTVYSESTYDTATGSKMFGALIQENDGFGSTVKYFYSSKLKLQATVNTGTGGGTYYTYDAKGRVEKVTPVTYTSSTNTVTSNVGAENVSYTYDSSGYLSTITTASTVYTFAYDAYGNTVGIQSGDNSLAAYEYNDYNGKLKKITYGNGFVEEYVYNDLEILEEIWYTYSDGTRVQAAEYVYTADGQLHRVDDLLSDRSTIYTYTPDGRIYSILESDTDTMRTHLSQNLLYNDNGLVSMNTFDVDYLAGTMPKKVGYEYSYLYNDDGSIASMTLRAESTLTANYVYDDLKRLISVTYTTGDFENTVEYSYRSNDSYTSGQVDTYTSGISGTQTAYSYDEAGRITQISGGGKTVRYTYDDLGQLIRVDDSGAMETYVYEYDAGGNRVNMYTYIYTTASAITGSYKSASVLSYGGGDLLTSYNGQSITYDAIGNPLTYYNGASYGFTWIGRQLAGATKGTDRFAFTYNEDGIRTSKTINGVTHEYYLNGTQIVAETWGDKIIIYLYDVNGTPIGMQYRSSSYEADVWDIYWYENNLQGDIVAVYNSEGTKLVTYTYDAWGVQTVSYSNGGGSTAAIYNPFRYRGYYYDSDLGLYYLNTRYYDANTGRFLNGDSALYHNLLGYNMYLYCYNDPVNLADYSGQEPISFFIVATPLIVTGVAIVALAWLAYDATHDQVLGNLIADVVDTVVDLADSVSPEKEDAVPSEDAAEEVPQSIIPTTNSLENISTSELNNKKDYDPNPYGRPGEKKNKIEKIATNQELKKAGNPEIIKEMESQQNLNLILLEETIKNLEIKLTFLEVQKYEYLEIFKMGSLLFERQSSIRN